MPSYVTPKKNAQYITYISLRDQADTKLMKSSPTIAAGDFKVSTDGGTLANLGTLPTVTPASSVMVKVTLSASEMNGDNVTLVCKDAAGAEWCDLTINIQTSANQIDDLSTVTQTQITGGAYALDTDANGRIRIVDGTGAGEINTNAGAIALVDTVTTLSGHTAQTADHAANITAIVADTNELQTDWANGGRLDLILDELTTQGDTNETKLDTIDTVVDGIQTDLDNGTDGLGAIKADTAAVLIDTGTTLDNHLTDIKGTGFVKDTHSLVNIEGYVDLIDDGTSGLAKIATDAAAILIDTAQIGTAGAGLTDLGGMSTAMKAEVNAECDTAVADGWTTTIAEAYPADGAAGTPAELMYLILGNVGEFAISGTTLTVKKLDGTTTAATYTLDDATNPTSRTRAT